MIAGALAALALPPFYWLPLAVLGFVVFVWLWDSAPTARIVTRRVVPMVATACAIGVLAGVGGLYLSYFAGVAAGAAIAGLLVAISALAALAQSLKRLSVQRKLPTDAHRRGTRGWGRKASA